ncbi:MAG: FtsX-like permease family protein, partial [Chitinophagaceae bacterium]
YFLDFTGIDLEIDFTQPVFIGLLVGFVLVIGVLAGAYPAFVLSSFKPLNILKSGQPLSGAKFVFRSLVVVQFAVSITLIVAAIFMYRQLNLIRSKDLGFDKANLVNVRLNGKLRDNIEVIKQDLEKLPAISAASPATMTLVNVNNTSNFKWDGMPADKEFLITQANIDPGFLQTLGIQLISGHNFSFQKTNDTANFILNQTAVRRMGYNDQTILGMGIDFWGAKGRVIGVVRDFNFKPLSAAVEPFVFRYQPMDGYFTLFVRLKPGNPSKALADLTTTLRKYESELPPEYVFVDESLDRLYENDKHTANMILLFSCLTILVGCLGLFGLSVIISQQRIREIGIRKVLGAGFASLAALLTTSYLRLVLIAGIVAIPAACVAVNYWLRDFAYKTTIDAATLAFVLVSVMAIACMVMLLQVVRVMRTNPALVMRRK